MEIKRALSAGKKLAFYFNINIYLRVPFRNPYFRKVAKKKKHKHYMVQN